MANHTSEWAGRHAGKDALRARIWALLAERGASVGDPAGHIPDFVGAAEAAAKLAQLPLWSSARVVKCNPDAPQIPVRLRALEEGKLVYMAVPRLRDERCFVELTAAALRAKGVALSAASSAAGALEHGRWVTFAEMRPIDLVLVGCVAVSREGGRTGKGAGFADLELGMLRQLGLVKPGVPIVTTVHDLQLVDAAELPMASHDSALDWFTTPSRTVETRTPYPQPAGIEWSSVRPEQFDKIPILKSFKPAGAA